MNGRTPHTVFTHDLPNAVTKKEEKTRPEKQPKQIAA